MSYMKGVEPAEAGWLTRLIYWFVVVVLARPRGRTALSNR